MFVGLRAGSREIFRVGLAVRAEIQDALADDADKVAGGTADFRYLAAEALIRVARDHQLSFLDGCLHDANVERIDRTVDVSLEGEDFAVRVMVGASSGAIVDEVAVETGRGDHPDPLGEGQRVRLRALKGGLGNFVRFLCCLVRGHVL